MRKFAISTFFLFLTFILNVSVSANQNKVVVIPMGGDSPTKCSGHPQWKRVECTIPPSFGWEWSSHKSLSTTRESANRHRVLWVGHLNNTSYCSLDGIGWVSRDVSAMSDCSTNWYHIGGSFTGNCYGWDGEPVRRLVLGSHDCYNY